MTKGATIPRGDSDIDILEKLFSRSGDTGSSRTTAERIINKAGGLAAAIACSDGRLRKFGATSNEVEALQFLKMAIKTALLRKIEDRPLLNDFDAVTDFCHATLAHKSIEEFWVLYMTNRNHLIRAEMMWTGTVNQAPAYPREILARALDLYASAMILVHNHPSGDSTASRNDIQMTRAIVDGAKAIGMSVHDHIIVSKTGCASMRALGLM